MQVYIDVRLYRLSFTKFYISEEFCVLPDKQCYNSLGIYNGYCCEIEMGDEILSSQILKLRTNAYFLQLFVKECLKSEVYRRNVVTHLNKLSGFPLNGTAFLALILEPPDPEIIDYAWNERILRIAWTRVEIENAFSWLSTLGGAYSALGDYFEHCAEEAGRISIRQYKLSQILGDDSLGARSLLYSALSQAQKGNLHISRYIVRKVVKFAQDTQDKRLIRMCHGVWAKLKYLRSLKNSSVVTKGRNCDNCEDVKVKN